MSATDNPCENAEAENFFTRLTYEEAPYKEYQTCAGIETNLHWVVEDTENRKRLHRRLDY